MNTDQFLEFEPICNTHRMLTEMMYLRMTQDGNRVELTDRTIFVDVVLNRDNKALTI
jgi:hypothetical protein